MLIYLLTYSMEQSPYSETNRFSDSQETPHILWNPKVHFRIHNFPPPAPVPSQLDPVHTPTSYFLKIHLNIILPCTPAQALNTRYLKLEIKCIYIAFVRSIKFLHIEFCDTFNIYALYFEFQISSI